MPGALETTSSGAAQNRPLSWRGSRSGGAGAEGASEWSTDDSKAPPGGDFDIGARPLPEPDPDGTPAEPLEVLPLGPDPASFAPPPSPRAGPLPARSLPLATGAGTASAAV